MERIKAQTADRESDRGLLKTIVTSAANNYPVPGAVVSIASMEDPEQILEEVSTDSTGQTQEVEVRTPPFEYSQEAGEPRPYAELKLRVTAPGFEPIDIDGTEVLPERTAIQEVRLKPVEEGGRPGEVDIPDHTLYGTYPPKIAEDEVKRVIGSGEIVLSRVVIPETIIVHDGVPQNASAADYYVPYRDYIKNVASSEIYATWPQSTIIANVLAIMSFTLNRVYTEWYRNKGYDFTITSSTAYDQKWIYGRNIFESISEVVDEIFDQYLSRPDVKQPILTQYCDGKRVSCPNWMSQWGSKGLGDQGYTPIEIIRYYYGDEMYINSAEQIAGIPASWPRYDLTVGSSGDKVRQMQEQLLTISGVYTLIPAVTPSGYYDEATADAVEAFQGIFGLPKTGVTDFATWYKISQIYVGITRIGELNP